MTTPVLRVEDLRKVYGDSFVAVDGISFSVEEGSVVGLLGPNGAGKTTTIQMLTGVTLPTSGTISFFGMDFGKQKKRCLQRINFTSAYNNLQGHMTVWENLTVFAALYSVKNPKNRINELSEYFDITDLFKKTFWHLSAGQRTRVNLVKSLINDPDLVMMDEPTASLDPDVRDRTLTLIEQRRKERGLSILYTSHNMDEVTRICDDVIFLDHGKIVKQDHPDNLVNEFQHVDLRLHLAGSPESATRLLESQGRQYSTNETDVTISIEEHEIARLLGQLDALSDVNVVKVDIEKPTLEDLFIEIARN